MTRTVADVVIIGAGPAGSAAARLLASWGHSAVLLGRPPRQPALGESLPPSCTKLFDQLEVRRAVDAAGFVRATGNTVRWADRATRVERFDAGVAGYQVPRDEFDALLQTHAQVAGALVQPDRAVLDVERVGDAWHVTTNDGELLTPWLIDASGRAGVVARRGLRRPERGTRTIAVAGIWDHDGAWPVADDTHTLVESYGGGWAWSVPVSAERRFVTVMLDPSVTDLRGREELGHAYAEELAKTTMLRELVHGARQIGNVWACDASPYSAICAADDRALLVGDAASFVDPLSSFGVKKALASAWLGAVAVHTALSEATMASAAMAFFDARERAMYEQLQRQSAELSREAAGAHAGTFWNGRSELAMEASPDALDVARLRGDPRVLAAFEELRRRPSIALRRSDALRFVPGAAVLGNRIVMEERLATATLPEGVRYCRNVDLVLLAQLADRYDQVPDLYDAYNRRLAAALPDFLGALSSLIGLGLLIFA